MRVAAAAALAAVDSGAADLPVAARVAASFCGDAYFDAAAPNIQVHGGIGFTWEHPAHLYYRRVEAATFTVRLPPLDPGARLGPAAAGGVRRGGGEGGRFSVPGGVSMSLRVTGGLRAD